MQIFPVNITVNKAAPQGHSSKESNYVDLFKSLTEAIDPKKLQDFGKKYSSFIEEGREKYTGRPHDFSAFEQGIVNSGLSRLDILKKSLKQSGAPEVSLHTLEQLVDSGKTPTVARLLSALKDDKRVSPELTGAKRNDFIQALEKLGFTKDQRDELLYLSDEGHTKEAWQHISHHIVQLDKPVSLHLEELQALLHGLDLSKNTATLINNIFVDNELAHQELDGSALLTLLADAGKEIAAKEQNKLVMLHTLRDAVTAAMTTAKLDEISQPSANTRADQRSLAAETRMQLATQKNAEKNMTVESTTRSAASFEEHGENKQHLADEETNSSEQDTPLLNKQQAFQQTSSTVSEPTTQDTFLRNIVTAFSTTPHLQETEIPVQTVSSPSASNFAQQRQEVFAHIEQGVFQSLHNGGQQISLQLNAPNNLGQLNVVISMHEGMLRAVIRADSNEAVHFLTEQIAELKNQLEENGIKVAEIDVHADMQEDSSASHWQESTREHNRMQDSQERARLLRLAQLNREAGKSELGTHNNQVISSLENGLHVIA